MSTPENYRVVEIHWEDSSAQHGWTHRDALRPKPEMIRSVGLMVEEDEDGVTLTASVSSDDAFDSPVTIPWSAVRGYWVLS